MEAELEEDVGWDLEFNGPVNEEEEEDFRDVNPLVRLLWFFITSSGTVHGSGVASDHSSSKSSLPARVWAWALSLVVVLQFTCLTFESMRGYAFLQAASEGGVYWQLYLAYSVPLVFDASLRMVVLWFVVFGEENQSLRAALWRDKATQCLLAGDILCVLPFILNVSLLKPSVNSVSMPLAEGPRVLLRILELSSATRILRLVKDISSVRAVLVALGRALPKLLLLPCFFFFLVVTMAASVFYFVEPCFDVSTCPWKDLVGATFFAASALTATGYGNQVPRHEFARFVAVLVMLSGPFLLSMPLAIFGNEYADVCAEMAEREHWLQTSRSNAGGKMATAPKSFSNNLDCFPLSASSDGAAAAVHSSPVSVTHARLAEAADALTTQCDDACRITPAVLNAIYMADAWMDPFLTSLGDLISPKISSPPAKPTTTSGVPSAAEQKKNSRGLPGALFFALRNGARELLGVTHSDAFLIEAEDESKQTLGDIIQHSAAEFVNPHLVALSFKGRIWTFLHVPSSSWKARCARVVLLAFIFLSVVIFYTETLAGFNVYDEASRYCESVVALYCADKARETDPGCFAQQGLVGAPLRFFCSRAAADCYGVGANFGSPRSGALSCTAGVVPPFQTAADLAYHYGGATGVFASHDKMQLRSAICSRMECGGGLRTSAAILDASAYWYYGELIICVYFSLEVLLRAFASASLRDYFANAINWCDLLALVPFYAEIGYAHGTALMDFSVLSSSPLPVFLMIAKSLKICRLLKLARYLHASKTLLETLRRVLRQLSGVLGFLLAVVVLAAIVLYEVEGGRECFVPPSSGGLDSSSGCKIPPAVAAVSHAGDRILVNENGESSAFPNAFSGIWFGFVTMSLTGFGDMVPITYGGKFINLLLMLAALYGLAIPVIVAASTFFHIQQRLLDKDHRSMIGERSKQSRNRRSEARALQRLKPLAAALQRTRQDLASFLASLHKPPPSTAVAQQIVRLPLDAAKSHLLSQVAALAEEIKQHLAASRRDILGLAFARYKRDEEAVS